MIEDAPTFGSRVLVRDTKAEEMSFTSTAKGAIALRLGATAARCAHATTTTAIHNTSVGDIYA